MSAWDWRTRFGVVPANWPKATRSRYVPQGKSLKDLASASPLPTRRGKFWHSKALTRSEEHTSELQSLMRISYAVFCLKKKNTNLSHVQSYIIFERPRYY